MNEQIATRIAVWVDDDRDFLGVQEARLRRQIRSLQFLRLSTIEELVPATEYVLRRHAENPYLLLVHERKTLDPTALGQAFSRFRLRAIISDLNIGRTHGSGLWLLMAAKTAQQPNLILCTSDPGDPGTQAARDLGVRVFSKGDESQRISQLLAASLDIQPGLSAKDSDRGKLTLLEGQLSELQEERKQLRRQIFRLQKAARINKLGEEKEQASLTQENRLGTMIRSHSHDLLNASSLTVQLLDHILADHTLVPPILLRNIERARITAKHCEVLVSSLGTLIQPAVKTRSGTCSVKNVLMEAREILARKTEGRIEVTLEMDDKIPLCKIPADLLIRVLLNILLNAIEAIPEKGQIFATGRSNRSKKLIVIEIRDSGRGIKKTDLKRVFKETFSTKGKQHGLGLTIVKQIVESYAGRVDINSKRGAGAMVRVEIPSA